MLSRIKLFVLIIMISFTGNNATAKYEKLAYDFEFKDLDGAPLSLAKFKLLNSVLFCTLLYCTVERTVCIQYAYSTHTP